MSKQITKFDIQLFEEVEIDSNLKKIGEPKLSAYLKTDNGMSVWICYFKYVEELLEFINPAVFKENLNEVLSEEELIFFVDNGLCCNIPYYFGNKEYRLK